MRPTPLPSPGLDVEVGLPPAPRLPDPLTDGVADRLVVTAPTVAASSATLVAARQLSEEAGRPGRPRARPPGVTALRRRHELRSLLAQRRSDLGHVGR